MSNRNGRRRGQRRVGGNNAVEQYRPNANATVGNSRDKPWLFSWKGQTYRLPPADPDTSSVTGGDVIDHVLGVGDREDAQLRMIVQTLMRAEPDARALAALREMPLPEFGKTMNRWLRDTAGAGSGESLSSSNS